MKKICHVTSAHPIEDGRIFRRACISTVIAGYDTYLVERGSSYTKNNVKIVGIGEPRVNNRIYRMTVFAFKAVQIALKIDADLYHLHDPELLPYAYLLKKRGKSVVFDSHENYVEQIKTKEYLPFGLAIVVSKIYDIFSRWIFKKIDGLTYPGDGSKTYFDDLCDYVTTTDNLPWLDELYNKYDIDSIKDHNSACYIGGLDESRGLREMIKASYDANCKLYLAGSFSSSEYQTSIQKMPEYKCVEYLGMLNRDGIVNLLNSTSIGFCTLLNVGQYYKMNNLPTKIYEYMSMSLPVIMSDSAYNISFNDKHCIGICVNPSDIDQFSEAIRFILDNDDFAKKCGSNGRELISEKYCWDIEQYHLIDMYNTILSNHEQ